MTTPLDKMRFARAAGMCAAVLALLAGTPLAVAQGKTTARMVPSKPVAALKAGSATPAGPKLPGAGPLFEGPGGVATQYQYFLGTSPVNGSTVQQEVVTFTVSSDSATFVPTVGLRYGINYSVGPVSCTASALPAGTEPTFSYFQTCTATVTFAPLYPGGHRDALFVYDTDGKTVLTGGFLYGIGLAPQLMIQPGVTTNLHLPNYPYLYGSTTDEAGTYYVYSNNDYYTVTKQGVASVFATSVPNVGMLSIDGAGSIFSPAVVTQGGYQSNNSSGYEIQTAGTAGVAYPSLCYTSPGDSTGNRQYVPATVCFDSPNAVAVGNVGTYYDADLGGESIYIYGQYVRFYQGFLAQSYGSYTHYDGTTTTDVVINPLNQVLAPQPVPTTASNVTNAGGIQPVAYPLGSGNFNPYAMVVDPYENVFFADHNYGLAVWCGWGTSLGLSSALTGSSNGCGGWGSSMMALTTQFNSLNQSMAVDAADTLYAGQSDVQMLSAANNYATPITTIGVSGGAGAVSLAPDGTVYVQGGINTINIIDRSQGSIDFGSNNQQTPNPYTMTLYNGGNQPLTIASIAVSGAGYSVQPTTTGGCTIGGTTVVAVGTVCQFKIALTPAHMGTSLGTVTITSNSLNGASTVQAIALSAEISGIYVMTTPSTTLAFGSQSASTTLPITVTNLSVPSNSVPYGSAVTLSGLTSSNPSVFAVSQGNCPASQASGTAYSCTLQVTYNPTPGQSPTGTISWTESATGGGATPQNLSVNVTGTGISPPVVLNVTAQNASRQFLAAPPLFSATITNSSGGAVPTITGTPAFATTAMLNSPAGTYPITPSIGTLSAPSGDSFTFVPGTLTVLGGVTPTITFHIATNNGNLPLALGNLTLTAMSTAGALGQPIVYSATGPATVSGSTLTLTGTGPVTVTATQAGNATFNLATATQSFTVTP